MRTVCQEHRHRPVQRHGVVELILEHIQIVEAIRLPTPAGRQTDWPQALTHPPIPKTQVRNTNWALYPFSKNFPVTKGDLGTGSSPCPSRAPDLRARLPYCRPLCPPYPEVPRDSLSDLQPQVLCMLRDPIHMLHAWQREVQAHRRGAWKGREGKEGLQSFRWVRTPCAPGSPRPSPYGLLSV